MNHGYLWCVTSDGVPRRISSKEKPEASDVYEWEDFTVKGAGGECEHVIKLASSPCAVFAIDRAGLAYIFVSHTHLAIRQTVNTYSNQRWYPGVGWCSMTLPTDRATFSNEDGTQRLGFESFSLRSDGWRWEEPWIVATDARKYDKEGWEYAFNFGRKPEFSPQQKRMSFVRRRLFKRCMRYVAVETWIQLAVINRSHKFLDICAGNFASGSEGTFELFVLSESGKIFRREGICMNNPEGNRWAAVAGVIGPDGEEDISAIGTSSASRCLLALSWDGRLFSRKGMTSSKPAGTEWTEITLPGSLPVTGFSLGSKSLWIVSVEAKIFTAAISVDTLGVHVRSPFRDAGEGMCRMSCSVNDQVLAISNGSEQLHVRTGVCVEEPYGRQWIPVVQRQGTERTRQVEASTVYFTHKSIPPAWIDANFVPISLDLYQIRNAEWRKEIIHSLNKEQERCWSVFKESPDGPEGSTVATSSLNHGWKREAHVAAILNSTGLLNWSDGTLRYDDSELQLTLRRGTMCRRPLQDLCSVYRNPSLDRPNLTITSRPLTPNSSFVVAFQSDDEREQWMHSLEQEIRRCALLLPRDRRGQWAWSIRRGGVVRCHVISQMRADKNNTQVCVSLASAPALVVPGHFVSISAGAERIVWALNKSGQVYALDCRYDPLEEDTEYPHREHDRDEEIIVEYQKYGMFRGFVTFEGCSSGIYAWTGIDGQPRDKAMRLPRGWSWHDPEWLSLGEWEYGTRLDGEWGVSEKKAHARRRLWHRTRVFEGTGPWMRVDAPSASEIHVAKYGEKPLVWLLTTSGEVLVRYGCERFSPNGHSWIHLPSEWPLRLLCPGGPNRVWAVTRCNRLLIRECATSSDIDKVDWREVLVDGIDFATVISMAACSKVLWLLCPGGIMRAILADKSGYLMYLVRSEHSFHRVCTDSDDNLWALADDGVFRKNGTIKEVRRSRPLTYEVPWEKISLANIVNLSIY